MHASHEPRQRRTSSTGWNGDPRSPRVVILDAGEVARIEILELPENTGIGASFCHGGTTWKITDIRTSSRVLIAKPGH